MLSVIKNPPALSLLLEQNFCVSIADPNGVLTYVNQNFCELTKYEEHELIGMSYNLLNPEFSVDHTMNNLNEEVVQNKFSIQRIHSIAKDGTPLFVRATILPILDDAQEIIQYISFDIDITDKIMSEEKHKKTVNDLKNIEHALNQSAVVAVTDLKGVITFVNDKFCELSQYSSEELVGQNHRILNSGEHDPLFFKNMWRTISSGNIWRGDVKNRAKDGSFYWVSTTIVPLLNNNGKPFKYIAIRIDITAKKEAEESLEIALKNDFRLTVRNLQNAIFKYNYDDNGIISFSLIEGKLAEKFGFITNTNLIPNHIELLNTLTSGTIKEQLMSAYMGQESQFEFNFSSYYFLVHLSPIFENNKVVEVVGTISDITERQNANELIERMAYYDYLTNLPNRRLFQIKVKEQLLQSQKDGTSFAIMFLDLDRFKNVNDSMGHSIGDQLLIAVADQLLKCGTSNSVVARHGGDEFVLLLPNTCAHLAEEVAKNIMTSLSRTFVFNSLDVFVSPSIGISLYPSDGSDYETLIGNADSAMYLAKEKGKNNYQYFTEELHQDIVEKTSLEKELRKELAFDQFTLHYQPQIDLKTGEITGLETLIRWNHPELGMIAPIRFIPIAEETGLIGPIGKWVLETACAQMKEWQDNGMSTIQISVNVSIYQFKQASFVQQVREVLESTGLSPHYLNLEITESMTSDASSCELTLYELRKLGINVSIDDFGTGYSSLSYLSKFPITHLKIDQAFVQELSKSNRAIIKTIISLAKNLDLSVIAEGVETKEQADFLADLDCDEVQGYLYSKPLPTAEIELLLKDKFLVNNFKKRQ